MVVSEGRKRFFKFALKNSVTEFVFLQLQQTSDFLFQFFDRKNDLGISQKIVQRLKVFFLKIQYLMLKLFSQVLPVKTELFFPVFLIIDLYLLAVASIKKDLMP